MSNAVLISIRPEWVSKILAGEKTLEVRKNRPNTVKRMAALTKLLAISKPIGWLAGMPNTATV